VTKDGRAKTGSTPQWGRIRSKLRAEFGEAAYRSWLKPASFEAVDEETVRILAPTRFMRDWIETQYGDRLLKLCIAENPKIQRLDIVHAGAEPERNLPATPSAPAQAKSNDDDIGAPLDPRFRFDNFVVGKPNEFAYAAAHRVAEATTVLFNPLFLYGGVGLGKTHLMHAIAWHIRAADPSRTVVYLSAEKFMYRFIRALREKNTMDFKDQFRSVDVLMIDDVQFISGKDQTQEMFFHTFNDLHNAGHQIVLTSDRPPRAVALLADRLRSRFEWGLIADIQPPDLETRMAILSAKAEELGMPVGESVIELIAKRVQKNVRELEGSLNRVVAFAQLMNTPITLESTSRMLDDLTLDTARHSIDPERIIEEVSQQFKVSVSELLGKGRRKNLAQARQVAMYLLTSELEMSPTDVGRLLGDRDHSTVIHGAGKINGEINEDNQLRQEVLTIKEAIFT